MAEKLQVQEHHPRFDLLRWKFVGWIVKSRIFSSLLTTFNLILLYFIIMAGITGTQIGNKNISVVFVWIFWFTLLIILLIPFGARLWCGICPIPTLGEWLQRGANIGLVKHDLTYSYNKKWPVKFRSMWIANIIFLFFGVFSGPLTTSPWLTSIIVLLLVSSATVIFLIFERRSFCRYVCPMGGFIGLYSQLSSLEIRAKDYEVCRGHKNKECVKGNSSGYGCPWMLYPGGNHENTYCGFCLECVRTCSKENISINIRPFGTDLGKSRKKKMDEAWKSLIMLGMVFIYSSVFLGPFSTLKSWAYLTNLTTGFMYIILFLGVVIGVVPAIFFLVSWLSGKFSGLEKTKTTDIFVNFSYGLIPLSFGGWIAFGFGILLPNGSYILRVISDPLGRGWDIFGTALLPWTPFFTVLVPIIAFGAIFGGLILGIRTSHKIALQIYEDQRAAFRGFIPILFFLSGISLALLWVFVGIG